MPSTENRRTEPALRRRAVLRSLAGAGMAAGGGAHLIGAAASAAPANSRPDSQTDRGRSELIDDFEREKLRRYEGDTTGFGISSAASHGNRSLLRKDVGSGESPLIYDPSVTIERGQRIRWKALPGKGSDTNGDTAVGVRFDQDNWFAAGFEGGGGESQRSEQAFDYTLHYKSGGSGGRDAQIGPATSLDQWYEVSFTWQQDNTVEIDVADSRGYAMGQATFTLDQFSDRSAGLYCVYNNDPWLKSYVDRVERVGTAGEGASDRSEPPLNPDQSVDPTQVVDALPGNRFAYGSLLGAGVLGYLLGRRDQSSREFVRDEVRPRIATAREWLEYCFLLRPRRRR